MEHLFPHLVICAVATAQSKGWHSHPWQPEFMRHCSKGRPICREVLGMLPPSASTDPQAGEGRALGSAASLLLHPLQQALLPLAPST